MDPDELPEGFELATDDDLPEGFEAGASADLTPLEHEVPEVPQGYAETGSRVRVMPEMTFEVDVNRPSRSRTYESAPGYEIREIDKVARGPRQDRPADIRDIRGRLRSYLSGSDPEALSDSAAVARSAGLPGWVGDAADTVGRVGAAVAGGPVGLVLGSSDSLGGIEVPSLASARRAIGTLSGPERDARGNRRETSASDVLSALLPHEDQQIASAPQSRGMTMVAEREQAQTPEERARIDAEYAAGIGQGDDVRELALLTGATAPVRWGANIADRLTGDEAGRRETQELAEQTRAQAPGDVALGETTTMTGLTAPIGAPASALGRIAAAGGIGLGTGALRGAGDSRAPTGSIELARDTAHGGLLEGAAAAGTAGLFEAGAPLVRRLGDWATRRGQSAADAAVQSRLEATGVWGGRAMRAADELPGGQEALAGDLRRLGIGHDVARSGQPGRGIPRPERALDDATEVAADAGHRMQSVLSQMDDASSAAPSPLAGIRGNPSRSLDTHRMAFEGLSPEEATAVATGQRPPVAGGRRWEPIDVLDETAVYEARGLPYRDAPDVNRGVLLNDGNHRLAAAREAGATHIAARVRRYGPDGEVVEDAVRILPIDEASDAAARGLVNVGAVADQIEAIARQYETIPIGGQRVAETLRTEIVEPLRARPYVTFREAHQQRMLLDDLIRGWQRDPNLTTAAGQLQTARRAVSGAMDQAAEALDPALREAWRQANRDYSVTAFLGNYGRGAERLSVGGGIGTQVGQGLANALEAVPGGGAVQMALGREIAQQQRMMWPGIRTRGLEALAPRLAALGERGQRWAQALEAAQRRGGVSLAAAHAAMQRRDPEYRRAVMALEEQQQEEQTP